MSLNNHQLNTIMWSHVIWDLWFKQKVWAVWSLCVYGFMHKRNSDFVCLYKNVRWQYPSKGKHVYALIIRMQINSRRFWNIDTYSMCFKYLTHLISMSFNVEYWNCILVTTPFIVWVPISVSTFQKFWIKWKSLLLPARADSFQPTW